MMPRFMQLGEHARLAVWRLWSVLIRERDRWVLWSAVGFGFGIGVYFALTFEPPLWFGSVLAAAMMLLVLWPGCRCPYGRVPAGVVAIVAAGFAAAQVRTAMVETYLLERRLGPAIVMGRIERFESLTGSVRVVISSVTIEGLAPTDAPERVRVSLRGQQPAMKAGDIVRIRAVLMPLPPPSTPSGFDFQRHAFYQGLGAVGYAYGRATIVSEATGREGMGAAIARLRQCISERIQEPLEDAAGSVAVALMTGERSAIPPLVITSMRDSGLAHLLSISGLHMGLTAGILFTASRALLALIPAVALRFPIKKIAAVTAIIGVTAYGALSGAVTLSGANIPAQRSVLMVGLVMLAVILDRRGLSMRGLAWAAIIILALAPESLVNVSFQLSFAAVVALIAAYESVRDLRQRRGGTASSSLSRVALYLGGVALTTLVASAATAPFAAFHFNNFAAYGLAANLIAVPLTAIWIMPWAVAAFILMPLGLEILALTPMGWGIDVVIWVALVVSRWPGAVSWVPTMPDWSIIVIALGGLWLCLWRTTWRYFGIAVVVIGLSGVIIVRPPDLLISGEGTLVAVRKEDSSLAFSTLRANRFSREAWLRQFAGDEEVTPWPRQGFSDDGAIGCDSLGCTVRLAGHVVAVAWYPEAVAEDCQNADILLSLAPVTKACPAPRVVIDRFDLWRNGAHAIWLNSGPGNDWLCNRPIRVKSVNGQRGDRPWVVRFDSQRDS
jgi:competence protein ComEC